MNKKTIKPSSKLMKARSFTSKQGRKVRALRDTNYIDSKVALEMYLDGLSTMAVGKKLGKGYGYALDHYTAWRRLNNLAAANYLTPVERVKSLVHRLDNHDRPYARYIDWDRIERLRLKGFLLSDIAKQTGIHYQYVKMWFDAYNLEGHHRLSRKAIRTAMLAKQAQAAVQAPPVEAIQPINHLYAQIAFLTGKLKGFENILNHSNFSSSYSIKENY
jgi:hypothetical protein